MTDRVPVPDGPPEQALRDLLNGEIRGYEIVVWQEDMCDPFAIWRTPRGRFYKQCADAWREFTRETLRIAALLEVSP